jgi:large subunit ribosomal protein L30
VGEVTVTQTRSANRISPSQRETLRSLKLGRIGRTATVSDDPATRGMLRAVGHLVQVKESK